MGCVCTVRDGGLTGALVLACSSEPQKESDVGDLSSSAGGSLMLLFELYRKKHKKGKSLFM